jgi:riboflavin synthase
VFTGIIEEIGMIALLQKGVNSARISIKGSIIFDDLKLGDSVAVNGVCLTAAEIVGNLFTADVMSETLKRSDLGELHPGDKVNMERAMKADGRFGGHIVSGHIDGTGRIIEKEQDGNAVWITVSAPQNILRYIIEKGSVAIDGISLTVARVSESSFAVSLIPHTGKATTLSDKKVCDSVNLENDITGKYIERFLHFPKEEVKSGITAEFLAGAGF